MQERDDLATVGVEAERKRRTDEALISHVVEQSMDLRRPNSNRPMNLVTDSLDFASAVLKSHRSTHLEGGTELAPFQLSTSPGAVQLCITGSPPGR